MDYGKTLNLPQTRFPMKADLAIREPGTLKFWEDNQIEQRVRQKNAGKPPFILHDGPPYSNGPIHLGTALNKILKDIVVKFRAMTGRHAPYVPGWDTHGLPIELAAIKEHGMDRRTTDPVELRRKCRALALHFVEVQKEQFKRLGVLGDWDHPYLTLHPSYEATVVRTFGEMALNGFIYRGKKSVYWCVHCETSLAEAEIEYRDKQSPSIYVKFPLADRYKEALPVLAEAGARSRKPASVVIWTTTPWTLPANVAIALHPEAVYQVVEADGELLVVAEDLWGATARECGLNGSATVLDRVSGSRLAGAECRHPFLDRRSLLIAEEYVTLDQGTGCVHTAPGHGADDFEAARRNNLPVLVPVDAGGILTPEAGPFEGLSCDAANPAIVDHLRGHGFLLHSSTITHSYPHCWRCHKPVIFRATDQWFIAMDQGISRFPDGLRHAALKTIPTIKWYPSWGGERIANMVASRPDWCISRQRVWGVPLPVFYCRGCREPLVTKESVEAVADLFEREGSDAWFLHEAGAILPSGTACGKCGGGTFEKETDIFDVWFESGVSHLAVLDHRDELSWPSDLYLEGSDQYRGWFQVSCLIAMAIRGSPPYREVVTNGWVLDAEGKTMHKSQGNAIDPMDVMKTYGADLLRLHFASVEFKNDVRLGEDGLKQTSDVYRQIRNSCRFFLGNLDGFDPEAERTPWEEMVELDRWALDRLHRLIEGVTEAYRHYDFHVVTALLQNFCVKEMSEFYLDVLKDRLYTYSPASLERRSARTALHEILSTVVRLMYPILSFTAEEVWQHLPWRDRLPLSAALADWPAGRPDWRDDRLAEKWEKILSLRREVYAGIEQLRKDKKVGRSEEVLVELGTSSDEDKEWLTANRDLLRMAFKVSGVTVRPRAEKGWLEEPGDSPAGRWSGEGKEGAPQVAFRVRRHPGKKCERCWYFHDRLSGHEVHASLCSRCLEEVMSHLSNR